MRKLNLRAKAAKKFKATTDSNHTHTRAPDLLQRDFSAQAANQKWVADITYLWTAEGWLYLAVVLDLYSRAVIGWSMGSRMTRHLVCDALRMALWRRGFPIGVIVHTDQGSQYASKRYRRLIKDNQLLASMGTAGDCYDNALMESFFHSFKVETIHGMTFATRAEAKQCTFEYIEAYYNVKRRHSAIDYKAPMEYEKMMMVS